MVSLFKDAIKEKYFQTKYHVPKSFILIDLLAFHQYVCITYRLQSSFHLMFYLLLFSLISIETTVNSLHLSIYLFDSFAFKQFGNRYCPLYSHVLSNDSISLQYITTAAGVCIDVTAHKNIRFHNAHSYTVINIIVIINK